MVTVYKPESTVLIRGLDALVLSVNIKFNGIQYEIAYWDKNVRHVEWVADFEIKPTASTETIIVGFKGK